MRSDEQSYTLRQIRLSNYTTTPLGLKKGRSDQIAPACVSLEMRPFSRPQMSQGLLL
jgi:hypothetical protein